MRVDEAGQTAHEIELAVFQLAAPVDRRILADEPAFAGLDLGGHDGDVFRPQTELARTAQGHETVGRFDHRLARHAAVQDAEAADVPPAFDERGFQSQRDGGAGGRVTGASSADDHEIVDGDGFCRGVAHGGREPTRTS